MAFAALTLLMNSASASNLDTLWTEHSGVRHSVTNQDVRDFFQDGKMNVCTAGVDFSPVYADQILPSGQNLHHHPYTPIMPKAPLLHSYNLDENLNFGRVFAPFVAKMSKEILPHVPAEVVRAAIGYGADLHTMSNADIFIVVQGFPGEYVVPVEHPNMLFRPQYWAIPNAPFAVTGQYNVVFNADVTFFSKTMAGLTYNGQGLGQSIRAENMSLHHEYDGGPIIASPGGPIFQGLEANKVFWSVTKDLRALDGSGAGRVALTMHTLLAPEEIHILHTARQNGQVRTVGNLIEMLRVLTVDHDLLETAPSTLTDFGTNVFNPCPDIFVEGFNLGDENAIQTTSQEAVIRLDANMLGLTPSNFGNKDIVLTFSASRTDTAPAAYRRIKVKLDGGHVGMLGLTADMRQHTLTIPSDRINGSKEFFLTFKAPKKANLDFQIANIKVAEKKALPAIANGAIYETGLSKNGQHYLTDGWGVPELYTHCAHTWSNGYSASMTIPGIQVGLNAQIDLGIHSYRNNTSVKLYINGRKLETVLPVIENGFGNFSFLIAGDLINTSILRIDYEVENPDFHHTFVREIGFAVQNFKITQ
ncbi:MAG: hypothetical protein ACK5O7_06735 [Holosporales bacterium]